MTRQEAKNAQPVFSDQSHYPVIVLFYDVNDDKALTRIGSIFTDSRYYVENARGIWRRISYTPDGRAFIHSREYGRFYLENAQRIG